jgi:hypothetical protein
VAARAQEPRTTRRPHIKGTTALPDFMAGAPIDQGYEAFRDWKHKNIQKVLAEDAANRDPRSGMPPLRGDLLNKDYKKEYFKRGGKGPGEKTGVAKQGWAAGPLAAKQGWAAGPLNPAKKGFGRQGARSLDEFEEFEDVGEDPAAESPAAAAKQDESPAAAAKQDFWDAEGRTEAASHEAQEHAKAEVMDRLGEEGWLTPESG